MDIIFMNSIFMNSKNSDSYRLFLNLTDAIDLIINIACFIKCCFIKS